MQGSRVLAAQPRPAAIVATLMRSPIFTTAAGKEEVMAPRRRKRASSKSRSIEEELEAVAADVAAVGSAIGDVASAEARQRIQSIRERLDDMAGAAGDATREGVEWAEDTIRERPVISLLAAFALGLVSATMLRR